MEGSAAVHHLVEEFHGQWEQLDHSLILAACRHDRKQSGHLGVDVKCLELV